MALKVVVSKKIPKDAVRVHLYDSKNVLMPRGSMQKESIGLYILERLQSSFQDWTEPAFGDNPPRDELLIQMHNNLARETEKAWSSFVESIK